MKIVILAGGLGTRISEETAVRPKPMIEIGGKPILWHIMKIYSHYGFTDFIICLGYRGYLIKEYFANYFLHTSDVTVGIGKELKIVFRVMRQQRLEEIIDHMIAKIARDIADPQPPAGIRRVDERARPQ